MKLDPGRQNDPLVWSFPITERGADDAGPTWSSPVPVDDVLLQGDCGGTLHAFDVSTPFKEPPELWSLSLGACIESTPSVFEDRIWMGTRGGAIYGIGDRRHAG